MAAEQTYTRKEILAQDIMDMHLGAFKEENEDFFDIDYYTRFVEDTAAEILKAEFITAYQMQRQEGGMEIVSFDPIWLKTEILEFKEDKESGYFVAPIKGKLFSFPYDKSNTAVQDLVPVKRDACVLSRTRSSQLYLQKFLPKSNAQFWWVEPGKCGLQIFATKNCCGKVKMLYVPAGEDSAEISIGAANMIKDRFFDLHHKAEGKIIKMANDSNLNASPQTELNKDEAR